ncbi:MAG: amino acid permease [Gammaproteobacteria bacterium]|jgi:APA family basic amino acid/polyamine antiporter
MTGDTATPYLARRLGVFSASCLVVSNMVGTGIFTTTGFLAADLGSPLLVLAIWPFGALLVLTGAVCYAELGINFPRSGGEYVYLSQAWGPAWGFVDGWVSFFAGFSAPIAVAAMAAVAYLGHVVPMLQLSNPNGFGLHIEPATAIACLIVVLLTLWNLWGVGRAAGLQNWLTGFKVIVIALFIISGFTFGEGSWDHFGQVTERSSPHDLFDQFAISLIFITFAYSGWNAATYVGDELKTPQRTLPRSLFFGTLLVAAIYLTLNILFLYALPLAEMKGVIGIGAQAADALFGGGIAATFSILMAVSLLATVNAMVMIGPRVYYAMAKDGAFLRAAARVHPRWQTPWVAIVLQGVCCCALILTGTFESLIYYIGFTLVLFSALAVASLLLFRRRPGWLKLKAVSFAYPLLPLAYLTISFWILSYTLVSRGWEALFSLLTLLAGGLIYQWHRQRTH